MYTHPLRGVWASPRDVTDYLDEFTFRFNRRNSRSRGKLFFRLAQQAVAVDPAPYESLVKYARFPEMGQRGSPDRP